MQTQKKTKQKKYRYMQEKKEMKKKMCARKTTKSNYKLNNYENTT